MLKGLYITATALLGAVAGVDPEIIGLGIAVLTAWVRIEHRITKVETLIASKVWMRAPKKETDEND